MKNSNIQSYQNTPRIHTVFTISFQSSSLFLLHFFSSLHLSLLSNQLPLLWLKSPIQLKTLKTLRTDTGLCSLNLLNDKDFQSIARVYHSQLCSQRKNEKIEAYIVPWLKVLSFPISRFKKSPQPFILYFYYFPYLSNYFF